MKPHPSRLSPLWRLINLEIREERRSLLLEHPKTRDRHSADLQLGSLAQAELEHGAPSPDVGAHDDLDLGGVGQDTPSRLAGHLSPVHLVLDPAVASHEA